MRVLLLSYIYKNNITNGMSPKSYTKIYTEVAVTLYLLLPFLEG